ncbi:hypothetical protein C5S53_03360 [Methanophagales archaeon]|nr:hypothetical protein C5S53_03360 [Methanophagales archaeon]
MPLVDAHALQCVGGKVYSMKNILPRSTKWCFVGPEGKPLSPMAVRDPEVDWLPY